MGFLSPPSPPDPFARAALPSRAPHRTIGRVQREATVPIGVWLPVVAAGVVLAWCWRSASHESPPPPPPAPAQSAAPASIPASAAAPNPESAPVSPDPVRDEPQSVVAAAPIDAGCPAAPARVEPDPPSSVSPPLPIGWRPLDESDESAFDATPFGRSAARFAANVRARLGAGASDCACSLDRLAPFVVVAAADDVERVRTLERFRTRMVERVLAPARLDGGARDGGARDGGARDGDAIALDWTGARDRDAHATSEAADAADAADETRAWGESWLAAVTAARAPPRWWSEGAIEVALAETLMEAFDAAPDEASIAPLFSPQREPGDEAQRRALAGSFAAFCLGAAGRDEHLRATWLELGAGGAPDPADPAELAARFGCTTLEELDALWESARRARR